ncbi:MAG TPA: hypothetical protein VH496_06305 [Mycobacterium sp.]|jgi:hypothetical protein
MTDYVDEQFAAAFAKTFADVWREPNLDRHESIWSDDIVLIQPLSPPMRGKRPRGWAALRSLAPWVAA